MGKPLGCKHKKTAWKCVREIAETRGMKAKAAKVGVYEIGLKWVEEWSAIGTFDSENNDLRGYFQRFSIWENPDRSWSWDEKIQLCDAESILSAIKETAAANGCEAYLMDRSMMQFAIAHGNRFVANFTMRDGFKVASKNSPFKFKIHYDEEQNKWRGDA